jgi:RNA polymerase-binding transcription factor
MGRRSPAEDRYGGRVDPDRARELLAEERARIEKDLSTLEREGPEEGDQRIEPGDADSEGLYQDEFDAGRAQDLRGRLAAVERAEARLADGTYGVSIESGERLPDARLEANPMAELTVEEEQRRPS